MTELKFDETESKRLAEAVGAEHRDCFRASIMALFLLDGAHYVEGFSISGNPNIPKFAIEHGWIETDDNRIIDVTWTEGALHYCASVRYHQEDINDTMERLGGTITLPIVGHTEDMEARRHHYQTVQGRCSKLVGIDFGKLDPD